MATDKPRYTVSVDAELFQKIEDFRFEHRFQTRSEAPVELIRRGLERVLNRKTSFRFAKVSSRQEIFAKVTTEKGEAKQNSVIQIWH